MKEKIRNKPKLLLIIGSIIIAVLMLGLLIFGCAQNRTQQALSLEEQEQLTDMTVYLDEIDVNDGVKM